MTRPGPDLALLLLAGYRTLVDAAVLELETRGYHDVRPSLHYAMGAIDLGADTASELGRALSVSKQAAAKTIALLEQRGWVAIEADPADGRRKRLLVTGLGHRIMREGEQIFDGLRRVWADRIGDAELERLESRLAEFVGGEAIRLDRPGWVAAAVTEPAPGADPTGRASVEP